MKENLRLVICLITGIAIGWWLSGSSASDPLDKQSAGVGAQSKVEGEKAKAPLVVPPKPEADAEKHTASALDEDQIARLKHDVEVKKREIHELMQQYDASLADKEKKQQLKQELAVLMEQYNQMVLPLAMAELDKERTN